MKIKLTELGRHEAWLRLSSIMKAGDEQVQLERKLASELLKNWRASYENALKGLFQQLPKEITKQAIEIITQSLSEALGHSFGSSQAVRDELRKYITKAYQAGKSEFGFKPDLKLPDIRAINILTKHNCYWLGEHFEKHIRERIAERTQEAIEDGIGRKELADQLRNDLGGEVGGYKYWDVVSSAALVRSRSFGCVSGMVEAGIVEYEILAMGDERMCPICGELDGKVYSVSEAQSRIDGALGIDSPEKFKEAFPWPPSTGERAVLPPFHGRCRCVLVMHESEDVIQNEEEVLRTKVSELKALDTEYERKYTDLQHQLEEALHKYDVDMYNALSAQQKEVLDKWRALNIDTKLRELYIEAAEKGVIFTSELEKSFETGDIERIREIVKNAPEDVRKIWNMYNDKMKVAELSVKGTSYYSPVDESIHIDLTKDKSSGIIPHYRVTFHELGHLIDHAAVTYSHTVSSLPSYKLRDTLKSEIDDYVKATLTRLKAEAVSAGKSPKDIKKADAYQQIGSEIRKIDKSAQMGISDIFSGATLNKVDAPYRHHTSYWKRDPNLLCLEFFAETFSSTMVNPQAIEVIKRYVPKSYEIFEKILKDMASKGA